MTTNDDVETIVDLAKQDEETQKESIRALDLFNNSDFQTMKQVGQYTVVRTKALEKGLEIATDTISRVSTERDHYREMVGNDANQQLVQDIIANKIARQNRNDKNRIAISEIKQTIEQSMSICKRLTETPKATAEPPVKTIVVASQKK